MAYVSDWEPIGAALKRIVSCGTERNQAKQDLCKAISDQRLRVRVRIDSTEPVGGGRTCDSSRREVDIPPHLNPIDIDWVQSKPRGPWPTRIQLHQNFPTQWDCMLRHLDLVELFAADVTSVLVLQTKHAKDPVKQLPRKRPSRERAERAIKATYPNGIPDQVSAPNALLCREVGKWLKAQKLQDVSDETILRAAGRRE